MAYFQLFEASVEGNLERVRSLLEQDAHYTTSTFHGGTPLGEAVFYNHAKIVKLLIQKGVMVDEVLEGYSGRTALGVAVSDHGETQNFSVIQKLVNAGANVLHKDSYGRSVLELAERNCSQEIIYYLRQKIDNLSPNHRFLFAAENGDVSTVQNLLSECSSVNCSLVDNRTALYRAASRYHISVVKFLLDNEASPDIVDNYGRSPLMIACDFRKQASADNAMCNFQTIQNLANKTRNINFQSKDGYTALMTAVSSEHKKAVRLLLEKQADKTNPAPDGSTALTIAKRKGNREYGIGNRDRE